MVKYVDVAIVDDHQMFADGLSSLIVSLDKRFRCQTISSPLAALDEIAGGRRFDLVISDLIMDSINGIAFLRALRNRGVKTPVLIISGITTAPPIEEALRLGARGFLPKSAPSDVLNEALETVLAGEIFLPPDLWSDYEENHRSANRTPEGESGPRPDLSQRQIEVLQLVSEGYSNRNIASMLQVSENTVKTHVKRIFKLLDVNSRAACVRKSQSIGLIR